VRGSRINIIAPTINAGVETPIAAGINARPADIRPFARGTTAASLALVLILAAGCAAKKGQDAEAADADQVNAGLSTLSQGGGGTELENIDAGAESSGDKNTLMSRASVDLEEALRLKRENEKKLGAGDQVLAKTDRPSMDSLREQPAPTQNDAANAEQLAASNTSNGGLPAGVTAGTGTPGVASDSTDTAANGSLAAMSSGTTPAQPAESSEQRAARVGNEFSTLMTERAATQASWRDFLFAAIVPAMTAEKPVSLKSPEGAKEALGPKEYASLDVARELVEDLTKGRASSGDPGAVADVLERARQALGKQSAVRIPTAVLCTRVSGYGRYEPFRNNVFPAGQANRAIVYVEVDRMAHRPLKNTDPGAFAGDEWAVEISQELELRLDSDSTLQWRRPEETVIETSRNKRRDFYLIQEIEIPATLSVGTYKLKVIVRDRAAGDRGRVGSDGSSAPRAEATIEFKIAADPNAAG
jgi:hypothetical protein